MTNANVMILGKTGAGKSTLINSVLRENIVKTGTGKPVTQEMIKISKAGVPVSVYDTRGLELEGAVQEKVRKEVVEEIKKRALSEKKEDYIHIAWYCINSRSSRIEDYEIAWIKDLSEVLDVIIIITQSIGDGWKDLESEIAGMNLPVKGVIPVLAERFEVFEGKHIEPFGLEELVDLTLKSMDTAAQRAFINAQKVSVEVKVNEARTAIKKHIGLAVATGATPIPFQDAFLLVPNQLAMISRINKIFSLELDKKSVKVMLAGVLGTAGVMITGKTLVSSALKLVPGVGSVAGGAISASTAGILTAALGYSYIETVSGFLKSYYDGNDLNIDEVTRIMKKRYKEYLKRGKELIRDIKR